MKFKFEPVMWLTTLATWVVALGSVQEVTHVLPPQVAGWLTAAAALGIAVLGRKVRGTVTPLAAPTAADGRKLVAYPLISTAGPVLGPPATITPVTPQDGTAGGSNVSEPI